MKSWSAALMDAGGRQSSGPVRSSSSYGPIQETRTSKAPGSSHGHKSRCRRQAVSATASWQPSSKSGASRSTLSAILQPSGRSIPRPLPAKFVVCLADVRRNRQSQYRLHLGRCERRRLAIGDQSKGAFSSVDLTDPCARQRAAGSRRLTQRKPCRGVSTCGQERTAEVRQKIANQSAIIRCHRRRARLGIAVVGGS